jgi:hypothetical protein
MIIAITDLRITSPVLRMGVILDIMVMVRAIRKMRTAL